jgi:hypothetical protein
MAAPKRKLPPALAANRWRPGQSGNPSGHSGEYGEAMKLARQAAPGAVRRLIELAELDQLDNQGILIPLKDLPEADRRVVTVAANSLLDRAFGRPKAFDPSVDGGQPLSQAALEAEKLTPAELNALEALAKARINAQVAREAGGADSDNSI